jgi:hypothetical protein
MEWLRDLLKAFKDCTCYCDKCHAGTHCGSPGSGCNEMKN